MTEDTRVSKEAIDAALTEWFGRPRHQWHLTSVEGMSLAITAADRVRGRSYIEWQPIESCPKTSKSRLVYCPKYKNIYAVSWRVDEGWIIFGAGDRLHEVPSHWAEMPAGPAWAETTPHADEPSLLASVESGGVQADGAVQGSPSADPSDDSEYLIKDGDEWWLAPGQGTTHHVEEAYRYPSNAAAEDAIREWVGDDDSRCLVVPALQSNSSDGRNVPAANAERVHAVCLSRMVEMLLNEVDRDTLARMRRAAYPESGE